MKLGSVAMFVCLLAASALASKPASPGAKPYVRDGLRAWNIMTDEWNKNVGVEDAFTVEWDYHMIHSDTFTGILGYVLVDPRLKLCTLTPCGANIAFAGAFLPKDGSRTLPEGSSFVHFTEYGHNFTASSTKKEMYSWMDDGREARIQAMVVGGTETLVLSGNDGTYIWDFNVTAGWPERLPMYNLARKFVPTTGTDVSKLPIIRALERWTVDMVWPRTKVVGQIRSAADPAAPAILVDGHGYRENSWGSYVFSMGGWDFAVFSSDESRVQFGLQTYHSSLELSFLDVSFYDDETLVTETYHAGPGLEGAAPELTWAHNEWSYHDKAQACVPSDTSVYAQSESYVVEATWEYRGWNQLPMLSARTPMTHAYVIMEHFPYMTGRISRRAGGEVVATFEGWAGGEYSTMKEPLTTDCSTGVGRLTHSVWPLFMATATAYDWRWALHVEYWITTVQRNFFHYCMVAFATGLSLCFLCCQNRTRKLKVA